MDPLVGQIQLFPYNFAPQGWAPCDGRTLSIAEYQGLFSLIGTTFGGNGTADFALPKLPGPTTDVSYYIAVSGTYPTRP